MSEKQSSLFDQLSEQSAVPRTDDEWLDLDAAVVQLFTPHGPIDEDALFAGRFEITSEVIDVVFQKGCHAIIYGERGVGKMSFANILRDKIFSRTTSIKVIKRNCTSQHNFRMIWQNVFDEYEIEGRSSDKFIKKDVNAYDIYRILQVMEHAENPVIIIDEFDRVKDRDTFEKMADLIKYLADSGSLTTIIIVGVGESVHQLFGGHPSIHRNVRQIRMPKMSRKELMAIFDKRLPILKMRPDNGVVEKIVDLSQGFPGYTHLIAQSSLRSSIKRKDMVINDLDLKLGIERCVKLADEIIQDAYFKAVRSTKPTHYYKEALTAFALAKTNDRGYFRAKDVKEPFTKIMGKPMEIPNFSRHLKEFQDEERGPVLSREGKPKSYEYRFIDPLLRPFAILYGIKDGLINMSDYTPSN